MITFIFHIPVETSSTSYITREAMLDYDHVAYRSLIEPVLLRLRGLNDLCVESFNGRKRRLSPRFLYHHFTIHKNSRFINFVFEMEHPWHDHYDKQKIFKAFYLALGTYIGEINNALWEICPVSITNEVGVTAGKVEAVSVVEGVFVDEKAPKQFEMVDFNWISVNSLQNIAKFGFECGHELYKIKTALLDAEKSVRERLARNPESVSFLSKNLGRFVMLHENPMPNKFFVLLIKYLANENKDEKSSLLKLYDFVYPFYFKPKKPKVSRASRG